MKRQKLRQACLIATLLLILATPTITQALPEYLDSWRTQYPDSTSGDINCQLCHIQRDGGSPWNAYGIDLRNALFFSRPPLNSINEAFLAVEQFNSDNDSPATSNLDEINANAQPGWRPGRVNIAFNRNGFEEGVFSEPLTIDPIPAKIEVQNLPIKLQTIAEGFTSPVGAVTAPVTTLSKQLFVVDQVGIIWRVELETGVKSTYLDVSNQLVSLGAFALGEYDERGLLSLAFHPDFTHNGRLYLYTSQPANSTPDFSSLTSGQTADHQSVLLELTISNPTSTSGLAQISTQRELLRVDQPQFNHNGGALVFDQDKLLYVSLGDGGGADDQGIGHGESGNGADLSTPYGAILRIDPLGNNSRNGLYGIPQGNPFVGNAQALNEIYAYGFRNPWKLGFDSNGDLYVADVGQNDIEEINKVTLGQHYGWPIREGGFYFNANNEFSGLVTNIAPAPLPPVPLIDPLIQYDHDEGISVIGGYVYRGSQIPTLNGKYVFADFNKRLFIGDVQTGEIIASDTALDIFIFSVAQDQNNELYVLGNRNARTAGDTGGALLKIESTEPTTAEETCLPIKNQQNQYSIICF